MSQSDSNYKGIFNKLLHDETLDMQEINFYEGLSAELYCCVGREEKKKEIDFYASQSRMCGKKILEIACGDGRVGIPLAQQGFQVTGIDISEDMLSLYQKKIETDYPGLRRRIRLIQGDICNVDIKEEFDTIIFPATTICLFRDDQILQIFKFAEEHLKDGGKFIFDREIIMQEMYLNGAGEINELSWNSGDKHQIAIYQEFVDWTLKETTVNMYMETIIGESTTRSLAYTKKRLISEELIMSLLEQSNLQLYRTFKDNEFNGFGVQYFVTRKQEK